MVFSFFRLFFGEEFLDYLHNFDAFVDTLDVVDKIVDNQTRFLRDEDKCALVEHRFGIIKGKYVLYRGETTSVDGIQYMNVEEYLKAL